MHRDPTDSNGMFPLIFLGMQHAIHCSYSSCLTVPQMDLPDLRMSLLGMHCPYVYLHTKLMTDAQEVAMAGSFDRKTLCDFIGMVCIFFLDGTLSLSACALYAGSCCSEILKSSGYAETCEDFWFCNFFLSQAALLREFMLV